MRLFGKKRHGSSIWSNCNSSNDDISFRKHHTSSILMTSISSAPTKRTIKWIDWGIGRSSSNAARSKLTLALTMMQPGLPAGILEKPIYRTLGENSGRVWPILRFHSMRPKVRLHTIDMVLCDQPTSTDALHYSHSPSDPKSFPTLLRQKLRGHSTLLAKRASPS